MNKLESIVVSNTEPNSKNVLWYDNKRLLIFSNGHWSPIVDLDDIDVDNLPNVSNLQEALKSLNIKVDNKVDKVTGKGLSTNDYTDADRTKLGALPTNTQLTQDLASKLNASVWNDAHEQFSIEGSYWSYRSGAVVSDAVWKRTPRIPLNRDAPIILKNVSQSGNAATCFFDQGGNFISAVNGAKGALVTIEPSAYPGNAVFVGISTRIEEDTTYSNGDTVEARESAVADAIQASKLALFIDQWNAACGSFGKYNPANAPDAQHPFYLNHIWLTYKEAMAVMTAGSRQTSTLDEAYINQAIRTHLPRIGAAQAAYARETFRSCVYLETVEMANLNLGGAVFYDCQNLRSINKTEPAIYNLNGYPSDNFQNCVSLVEIRGVLRGNCDISFSDSPLLSLSSLEYMVSRAVNTQAITVTVHPDVYAKLTGDTTNAAAAALSADELAQWQSLVSAAAAKNIAFATTE